MTWKKIHEEIKYLKLDFRHSSCSSPGPFFSSVFSGFFFCRFLSFLCLGSFLFRQVPFFFFTMGSFLLHVLSGSFFFYRFLSFLCLGSFLFLQVPFFFFTMGFFLLRVLSGQFFSSVFSGFFFCGFLSLLYLGSFLLLHHGFLSSLCSFYSRGDCSSSSSVGHFVFFSSSISDLLQFFKFVFLFYETRVFRTRVPCGKNISMSTIDLESLRLDFLSNLRC